MPSAPESVNSSNTTLCPNSLPGTTHVLTADPSSDSRLTAKRPASGILPGMDLPSRAVQTITTRYAVALARYAAATGLAFVNVWLSLSIHLMLALRNGFSERA